MFCLCDMCNKPYCSCVCSKNLFCAKTIAVSCDLIKIQAMTLVTEVFDQLDITQ